jgi:selenide, water dikinase
VSSVPRLLLIGGGHTHVALLGAMAAGRLKRAETTLVSPHDHQVYSGMVPGLIGGRYSVEEVTFDLPALTGRAGVRFLRAAVTRIDGATRRATLDDGTVVPYDVASVATGGSAAALERPGVAAHALLVKPINRVLELLPAIDRAVESRGPEPMQVVVVGGGAAGIEVALALRARLDREGASRAVLTLYDNTHAVLRDRAVSARREAERALQKGDVTVRLSTAVEEVGPSHVRLSGGRVLPADLVIWTPGTQAPSLFRDSGLTTDSHGFLLVEDTLEVRDHPGLFGVGDAATLADHPHTPKAGVYAVRQAPVLLHNLDVALRGRGSLRRYRPQPRFLALLNTGDGRAIFSYGSFAATGRWAMILKDYIDRGFMRRYQRIYS